MAFCGSVDIVDPVDPRHCWTVERFFFPIYYLNHFNVVTCKIDLSYLSSFREVAVSSHESDFVET